MTNKEFYNLQPGDHFYMVAEDLSISQKTVTSVRAVDRGRIISFTWGDGYSDGVYISETNEDESYYHKWGNDLILAITQVFQRKKDALFMQIENTQKEFENWVKWHDEILKIALGQERQEL